MSVELDRSEVDRLLNYFHVNSSVSVVAGKAVREKRDVDLVVLYRRLAPSIGRNNALYRASSLGRDIGMSRDEVERRLIFVHGHEVAYVEVQNHENMADRTCGRLEGVSVVRLRVIGTMALAVEVCRIQ